MAVNNVRQRVAYGITDPLLAINSAPIVSQRAPTTADKAEIATIWIDVPNDDAYILTSIVSNSATWINSGGGPGVFNSLAVTTFITAGTTITAGTGLIATTGGVTADAGDVQVTLGNVDVDLGDINVLLGDVIVSAGDVTVSAGNVAATLGSVAAGTTVTGGTGLVATTGDVTSTAGNLVASTAGMGVVLGGVAKIVSGTGNPNTVVTAPLGSLYLNLTGAGVADRAWLNTDGVTAWTAISTVA